MGNFPKSISGIILVITLLNIVVRVHSLQYPQTFRDENIVDDYHGTKVKDPYRWLEERDSSKVSKWVGEQNDATYGYLKDCQQRKEFKKRFLEVWQYPKPGIPLKRGKSYFYHAHQSGGEVLYVQDGKDGPSRILVNPRRNGLLAASDLGVSPNAELVVYREVTKSGEGPFTETGNARILNVSSGAVFPDVLEDVGELDAHWDKKSLGFFYLSHEKLGESGENEEDSRPKTFIYYHKVGSDQSKDVLAVDHSDFNIPPNFVTISISEDGKYMFLTSFTRSSTPATTNYYADLSSFGEVGGYQKLNLNPLMTTTKCCRENLVYVSSLGPKAYFRSAFNSKNYELIEMDLTNPNPQTWRVIVEANPSYILQDAIMVDGSKMVLQYSSSRKTWNKFAELRHVENGSLIRLFPAEFGEVLSFSGRLDDSEVLFRSNKLEGLPEVFYFDVRDPRGPMKPLLVSQPSLGQYNKTEYVTEVVSFPSVGGENVEMVLQYRKGLKRDGSAFAFLLEREVDLHYSFRLYLSYMKDFEAVLAFPRLEDRGARFRNSALQDFIAAAEYLVQEGYSNGSRIIARGQSTFGLFVASAVNKRPELFGAVVAYGVPFDMLRFDIVVNETSAVQDLQQFERAFDVSPLHNIRSPVNESFQYPGIFIPTPNLYPVPLAYKYLAELQHTVGSSDRQTKPFLIRVAPEPSEDLADTSFLEKYQIARETDIRCFLEKTLGLRLVE